MAETITLRAYLNDLRGMVENESPTEVVSHCRYILQHYPQNVATYRLLGRALLQKGHNEGLPEHFVQAADIFQRVLSVIPDDQVAHLALSEIREQEGALDQAIWHLERAHEQMPGNTAVEEALRRLYTRRTGQETKVTDKLQLSQGALARQYANSQLYDEAVLELRRALHDDPERVDLQVLLAKLLWESQHRVEAGEVALEVLKRLPNCLEANALMARLWLAYNRPSDAQPYLDRVEALDPYVAASILRPDGNVPDRNTLTRLDYTARAAAALSTETPEWVHELDDFDARASFGAPGGSRVDAIDTDAVFGAPAESAAPPDWVQGIFAQGEDEMPDWFAAPSPAPADEQPASSEPAPASWLEDLDTEPAEAALPEPDLSELLGGAPDWFGAAGTGTDEPAAEAPDDRWSFDLPGEDAPLAQDDMRAFEQDQPWAGADQPFAEPAEPEAEVPDWFAGLGNAISAEPAEAPAEEEALDPLAWLDEDTRPERVLPEPETPEGPLDADWLAFDAEQAAELPAAQPQSTDADAFTPEDDEIADLDRLFEALTAAEQAQSEADTVGFTVEEAKQEDELAERQAPAPSDDWLAIFQESEPADDLEPSTPVAEAPVTETDVFPWETPEAESPPEADTPADELPWELPAEEASDAARAEYSPFEQAETVAPEPVAGVEEEATFDEAWAAFDTLSEDIVTGAVADAESAAEVETPAVGEPEISTGELFGGAAAADDDDLLAALSQAAADEDDWLAQFDSGTGPLAAPQDQASEPEAVPADEDWLREIQAEAGITPLTQEDASAESLLSDDDLLHQLESEAEQGAPAQDEVATPEPAASDEDWLRDIQVEAETAVPPQEEAPAEAFASDDDWLRQLESEAEQGAPAQDEAVTPEPAASDEDWLREIQAEAEIAVPPQEEAPAEAFASDDDWLRELASEADLTPAAQGEAPLTGALPDEDILAIFGEPVEPAVPEPSETDFAAFDWSAAEADAPAAETPAWMVDERAQSEPEPLDQAAEPASEDWLGALSDEEGASTDDFAPFEEETLEDKLSTAEHSLLRGLAAAVEDAQPAEVPDWMAGLEIDGAADAEVVGGSVEDDYDPFEGGDPANVPSYESAVHTGILQPDEEPDWMRVFEIDADAEDEGTPVEEDAVPDFAAADLVDEPDDALAAFDAVAQTPDEPPREAAPAETFDAIEWDMPGDDLILGVEPEPRAEADVDIPDWLSAITQTATQDDVDAASDIEDVFAADAEAVPDWLREIEEPASDAEWAAQVEEVEAEPFAPAADLADTRDASPATTEDEDDFGSIFSFEDREPTWMRRASQRPDDGFERD